MFFFFYINEIFEIQDTRFGLPSEFDDVRSASNMYRAISFYLYLDAEKKLGLIIKILSLGTNNVVYRY